MLLTLLVQRVYIFLLQQPPNLSGLLKERPISHHAVYTSWVVWGSLPYFTILTPQLM